MIKMKPLEKPVTKKRPRVTETLRAAVTEIERRKVGDLRSRTHLRQRKSRAMKAETALAVNKGYNG